MPTLTVASANVKPGKENVQTQHGAKKVIVLQLKDGDELKQAEWFTNATTPLPAPGSTLDGELEAGQYGLRFKKAQQQGGFGGPRPEDPVRSARILRQHSQMVAIQFATLMHSLGRLPEDFGREQLVALVDWFDADVNAKGKP